MANAQSNLTRAGGFLLLSISMLLTAGLWVVMGVLNDYEMRLARIEHALFCTQGGNQLMRPLDSDYTPVERMGGEWCLACGDTLTPSNTSTDPFLCVGCFALCGEEPDHDGCPMPDEMIEPTKEPR